MRFGAAALLCAACATARDDLPVLIPASPLPEAARVFDLAPTDGAVTRVHAADVAALDAARWLGPAVVLDLSANDEALRPDDLRAWEARHGAIPAGAIVLVRAGGRGAWSEAAARFLIEERAIAGVGVDAASLDAASADGSPARTAIVRAGLWAAERLSGLDALPEAGATVVVLPVARAGEVEAPARAIALLPR